MTLWWECWCFGCQRYHRDGRCPLPAAEGSAPMTADYWRDAPDTAVDPPRRDRMPTAPIPVTLLPGYEPGRVAGILEVCDKFLEAWISDPRNDVGAAFLLAERLARSCGVVLPRRIPGAQVDPRRTR